MVMTHRAKEESDGKEWWPATPQYKVTTKDEEEVEFCNKLDCLAGKQSEMEW
jgi:hypothetical protein